MRRLPREVRVRIMHRLLYKRYDILTSFRKVLDERIDEFGEMIHKYYNIDDLGDPSATSEVGTFS